MGGFGMSEAAACAWELAFGYSPDAAEACGGELERLLAAAGPDAATLVCALLALRREREAPEHARLAALSVTPLAQTLRRADRLDRGVYERAYAAILHGGRPLIIGQDAYLPQHKERFWELFNACATVLDGRAAPRILEFGSSEFSALYRPLCSPVCGPFCLHLSDRPTPPDYIGFTEDVGLRLLGGDAWFTIDLERPATVGAVIASGTDYQPYDLIILAEVLEHLVVNPVDLLRALLALLRADGLLYLTTPNVFRAENRDRWLRLENPQQVFPPADENWDRHHHHREYGAVELLRFIAAAGGHVVAFYYSACWDEGRSGDERGNLVFLIGQADPA
jgi:SAM-dependent methyltransferase